MMTAAGLLGVERETLNITPTTDVVFFLEEPRQVEAGQKNHALLLRLLLRAGRPRGRRRLPFDAHQASHRCAGMSLSMTCFDAPWISCARKLKSAGTGSLELAAAMLKPEMPQKETT